jgi:hypothetical protein
MVFLAHRFEAKIVASSSARVGRRTRPPKTTDDALRPRLVARTPTPTEDFSRLPPSRVDRRRVNFLEIVDGRSPEQAGLLLICTPLAMVALSWLAGRTSDLVGSRWLTSGGMAVIGAGLIMLSRLPTHPSMFRLVGCLVVAGIGMSAFSSPNTSAVMGSVPRSQLGVASGTLGTMRFLGQTLSMGSSVHWLLRVSERADRPCSSPDAPAAPPLARPTSPAIT